MAQGRSTEELARKVVHTATELVDAEVDQTKRELGRDAVAAAPAIGAAAGAAVLGIVGLELLVFGISGASRRPGRVAITGIGLLATATALGLFAIGALPRRPLRDTRRRLAREARAATEELVPEPRG